jgi:hypothetical protein
MDTCVGSLECSAVVAAVPAHDHLPPSGEATLTTDPQADYLQHVGAGRFYV